MPLTRKKQMIENFNKSFDKRNRLGATVNNMKLRIIESEKTGSRLYFLLSVKVLIGKFWQVLENTSLHNATATQGNRFSRSKV